ncbi:transforming growth factor-beta-induced protein ig-h3-like isoform X1 [Tachypleus tridentatus]|uniref:transforming growth factor-beta-induced protein ig-h3-like isoform X1 n=1 Tax=Tachypleus tridentatus TaxID=6853 RepID=UPI003FCFCEB7
MEYVLHRNSLVFLFLIFVLCPTFQCRRIPWWHIKIAQRQGPNTCAVEEVPGTNKKYWTECKYWMNREICGVQTVIRYECCEGFHLIKHKPGCMGVKPMTNVLDTAKSLGATQFVDYLTKAGLAESLRHAGSAVTLFAPTNEAFDAMDSTERRTFLESVQQPESSHLLYHMVGRKLHTSEFRADLEIESLFDGQKLRINRYSNGMMTVNCGPVVRKDQEAKNGIVHLIDRVLVPPGRTGIPSIPEILEKDERFRSLARTLFRSNLASELNYGGPYTLLAPSDESFQKIPSAERARMTNDPEARLALLKQHVIPHTVCVPGITGEHKLRTIGGDHIEFHCNQSGTFVNDVKISPETIMSKNGVINPISDVLVPERARSVLDLAHRSNNLKTFSALVHSADMEKELVRPNITITVFAPSDNAFEALPEERRYWLKENADEARNVLNYHIIKGRVKTNTFSDSQRLETIGGNQIRLKVYRKSVGVESAMVSEGDKEGQNGVIHVINKVLTPPQRNTLELLENNDNFSIFTDAVQRVRKVEPQFLSSRSPSHISFTVFAPTNQAFKRMRHKDMKSIMKDEKSLKKFVQNHVVDDMISSHFFRPKLTYDIHTEYDMVKVRKKRGHLMVNSAHIVEPDLITKDGIVHCIDKVLMPKQRRHVQAV